MKSITSKFLIVCLLLLQLSGCSTMFGRQHDEEMVVFDANVPDVEVICSGKRVKTPGSMPLRQSKSHSCTAEMEGYEKKIFRIRSGTSWSGFGHSTALNTALWGWWTLGIGTGIGWLIDFPSGAMRNLKEDNFFIEMSPAGTSSLPGKVLDKTINIGKTLVNMPQDLAKDATGAVLDTTVRGTANQLGMAGEQAVQKETPQPSGKVKKI